jgi:hypothetical protein
MYVQHLKVSSSPPLALSRHLEARVGGPVGELFDGEARLVGDAEHLPHADLFHRVGRQSGAEVDFTNQFTDNLIKDKS